MKGYGQSDGTVKTVWKEAGRFPPPPRLAWITLGGNGGRYFPVVIHRIAFGQSDQLLAQRSAWQWRRVRNVLTAVGLAGAAVGTALAVRHQRTWGLLKRALKDRFKGPDRPMLLNRMKTIAHEVRQKGLGTDLLLKQTLPDLARTTPDANALQRELEAIRGLIADLDAAAGRGFSWHRVTAEEFSKQARISAATKLAL